MLVPVCRSRIGNTFRRRLDRTFRVGRLDADGSECESDHLHTQIDCDLKTEREEYRARFCELAKLSPGELAM